MINHLKDVKPFYSVILVGVLLRVIVAVALIDSFKLHHPVAGDLILEHVLHLDHVHPKALHEVGVDIDSLEELDDVNLEYLALDRVANASA